MVELPKAAEMFSCVVERGTLTEISPSWKGWSTETQWMKHWVKITASYLYNVLLPEKVFPTRPYYLPVCCHHHRRVSLIHFWTPSICASSFSIDKHLVHDGCLSMWKLYTHCFWSTSFGKWWRRFLWIFCHSLPHRRPLLPNSQLQRRNENIFYSTDQLEGLTFFKVIGANMIFALHPLSLRAAVLREIPFQEVAALLRAAACHGGAAVEAVVVREGMLLVTGVVVVIWNYDGFII